MKNINKVLLHGENVFKPVNKLPKGKVTQHKIFVAGHSESGHHHVLEAETAFNVIEPENLGDSIFIELLSPGKVVHQKTHEIHETKVLQPGIYEVFPAQEYNPFEKVMQKQWD